MDTRAENVNVAPSPIHGEGVFAAGDLRQGDRILTIDDSNVVPEGSPLEEVEREHGHHCDYLAGGKVVILTSPDGCFNHSCEPNTFVKTLGGVRYCIALRDIRAGEELTHDYCINSCGDTVWTCNCGSARCRRTIHSDFFHLPLELQLEYLPLLDDWFIEENRNQVEALLSRASR